MFSNHLTGAAGGFIVSKDKSGLLLVAGCWPWCMDHIRNTHIRGYA